MSGIAAANATEAAPFSFLSSGVVPCATPESASGLCRPGGRETFMERWRSVIGYEGLYEVSDLGRVRSLDHVVIRRNGYPQTIRGRIKKTPLVAGYPSLVLHDRGTRSTLYVHHLVVGAFIGPRPPGKEVAHWDGDETNVTLSNLRYATPIENDADKIRHGTRTEGSRNGQARLTDQQVREIRRRSALGERRCDLAEEFGISAVNITNIVHGRIWRCLL
jgi:hypothetical protein